MGHSRDIPRPKRTTASCALRHSAFGNAVWTGIGVAEVMKEVASQSAASTNISSLTTTSLA